MVFYWHTRCVPTSNTVRTQSTASLPAFQLPYALCTPLTTQFMISFWLPSPVTTAKKADPSSKQQKTVVIEVLHVKFPHATFLFLAQAFYSLTGILFCFLMLSAGRREPSKYLPIITAIV